MNQEIPSVDELTRLIYTKWSDYHTDDEINKEVWNRFKSAAKQARLEIQGFVRGGLSVDEAMLEVWGTMYPKSLILPDDDQDIID